MATIAMMVMRLHGCTRGKRKTIIFSFVFTNASIGTTHTHQEWLVCRSGTLAGPMGLESTEPHQGGVGGTQKAREMDGKLPLSHCNFGDLYFNLG